MMALDYVRDPTFSRETHERAAKRLYDCFCLNGGPAIKMGQMIGQLGQLVPVEYSKMFEPMCSQAPTSAYEDVVSTVCEELGIKSIGEIFSHFDEKPVASASLAQVHRAKLKRSGEEVAVKVQHRWIKEQVPGDIKLVKIFCSIAGKLFSQFKYQWVGDEYEKRLPLELDF